MLSFYDWYADLPVACPQVFGDQTDVPESADWWNASYLMMWGSNVPGDAHARRALHDRGALPRPEGRHRLARLRRQHEVRRRVARTAPRHGRRARARDGSRHPAGVPRRASAPPRFDDYMSPYTDATVPDHARAARRRWVPDKFLTADRSTGRSPDHGLRATPRPRRRLQDGRPRRRTGSPRVPNGSLGHRFDPAKDGVVEPRPRRRSGPSLSIADLETHDGEAVAVDLPRFDVAPTDRTASTPADAGVVAPRRARSARVGDALVTTVFDLLLAQYGVGRDGLPGAWPTGYDEPDHPAPPRGRRRSPAVPGRRGRRASAASSPTTPRRRAAAR